MSRHLFLIDGIGGRWKEAFADAVEIKEIGAAIRTGAPDALAWIDVARADDIRRLRSARPEIAVVALSASPGASEGLQAFSLGVRGYCHALATPEQLRQVAVVIANGGLWIGSDLMDRTVAAVGQVVSGQPSADSAQRAAMLEKLSPRERDVALQVAGGASNKDVARRLNITERTVKAHLTSTFDKLEVRDRLQLVIALRRGTEPPGTLH